MKTKYRTTTIILIITIIVGAWSIPAGASPPLKDSYIINGVSSSSMAHKPGDDFKVISSLGDGYKRLYDYPMGYSIDYPVPMQVDCSFSPVKTVLASADTSLDIYYDNFTGTVHNPAGYIKYSRGFLQNKALYQVDLDRTLSIDGYSVDLLQWHRPKILSLANDRNYYLHAIFVKNQQEVLTLLLKSSQPIDMDTWMRVINSVSFIPKEGNPALKQSYSRPDRPVSQETQALFDQYFSENASLSWGIYEYSAINGLYDLNRLENQLGYRFHFLVWYQSLGSEFPRALANQAYEQGKYLELTMATWDLAPGADNRSVTYDVLNGKYDAYLSDYARKVKDFGHPLLFRLNNEMNGDWCAWSAYYASTDTELFCAMWRHIYDIFKQQGVDNALWVWNPNDQSFPGFKWNSYLNYFPGSAYVDIIGLTGYNTGTYYPGERWRDFRSIYAPLYHEYSLVFDYPFIITEFGCNSVGGDKPAWLQDMFRQIGSYKKIKAAIWFNGIDVDAAGQPARIYRLDENKAVMEQFAQGLKNSK
ncbi:MAG: endoglucanase [Syntrophomonadaceae bacterium]|nr:endoglucanase [Syntrophomonadaceae bacterium]